MPAQTSQTRRSHFAAFFNPLQNGRRSVSSTHPSRSNQVARFELRLFAADLEMVSSMMLAV